MTSERAWSRPPKGTRGDIVGVRTLPDGRTEYLMHNEALCHPYHLAASTSTEPTQAAVELERETDGRWIAEVPSVPGAMAYGATPTEAAQKAQSIAQTAVGEGELPDEIVLPRHVIWAQLREAIAQRDEANEALIMANGELSKKISAQCQALHWKDRAEAAEAKLAITEVQRDEANQRYKDLDRNTVSIAAVSEITKAAQQFKDRAEAAEAQLAAVTEERDRLLDRVPERDQLIKAFVRGAKWWEFEKTGATMWQSDQNLAEAAAEKKFPATSPTDDRVEQVGRLTEGQHGTLRAAVHDALGRYQVTHIHAALLAGLEGEFEPLNENDTSEAAPPSGATPTEEL